MKIVKSNSSRNPWKLVSDEGQGYQGMCPNSGFYLPIAANTKAELINMVLFAYESRIKPRCSMSDPPKDGQRVNYWFAPGEQWHTGTYQSPEKDGGAGFFSGRSGFCDHHDAPWWLPLPPAPEADS